MNNNQKQVILTGIFGDGHLSKPETLKAQSHYKTSCKHKEYLDYKKSLLGDMFSSQGFISKNGYSQTPIHTLQTKRSSDITNILQSPIENCINNLDNLGVALWFYDDGSMHKSRLFYNLNTQAFSKEVQTELFIPFFNKMGIYPKITIENKKDGRTFHYLRIDIHNGAFEINNILRKYRVNCFNYKIWPDSYHLFYKNLKDKGLSKEEIKTHIKKEASKKCH